MNKFATVPAVLLADEMGLGKTVTAIAIDKMKRELQHNPHGRTLVIAPLSVLDVWREHLALWNPSLTVRVIDPKNRALLLSKPADVYIVHWDALRLMPELNKHQWFHVIADEAHRAKNRKAQMTQAFKRLHTDNKLASTGTPADDKPHDMWSILNWLYPKTFSSYWRFYNNHIVSETHPKGGFRMMVGVRNVRELHRSIQPFYIRRTKDEVLPDLPDKYYTEYHVKLNPRQRKAYEAMKKDMLAWVGENEDKPLAAPVAISRLMRLQQFALADIDIVDGWKQKRLTETWIRRIAEGKDAPPGPSPSGKMPMAGHYWIQGKIYRMVEPSSKLDTLMQILEDNPNESVVVFSQFKQVINLLGQRLTSSGILHGLYTGDTSKEDRDRIVRDFQTGDIRVFGGTIRAGGEGITLTRSRTMVFTDRDWSPTKNRQAEDREHRVGQKGAVQIIDLVADNTVDRGRLQQIDLKWSRIKEFLGES